VDNPEPAPPIAITAAARALCVTDMGVRDLVARGKLQPLPGTLSFDPVHVEQLRQRRQAEALDYCADKGIDVVGLAERAGQLLRPITTVRSGVDSIPGLPKPTRKIFGRAALKAAALRDGAGCRWCLARGLAELYGTPAPAYAPAFIALFGGQAPCEEDRPMLAAAMAELSAGVYGPAGRPSEARPAATAAQRPTAPPPTAHAAVQRPAAGPAGRATPSVLHAALRAAGVRPDRHEHGPSVVCPRCTP
jgi:hypothetical protein